MTVVVWLAAGGSGLNPMMPVTKSLVQWLITEGHCVPEGSTEYYAHNAAQLLASGTLSATKFKRLSLGENEMSAEKLFEGRTGNIRVKSPSEQYSEKRYTAKNKHGQAVIDPLRQTECETQSEGSKARAGVLMKHLANRAGVANNPLSEHERGLLDDLCHEKDWCGKIGTEHYDSISGHRNVKALIDDSTSGGLEIVPIEFDSDVVTFPLLNGELFPDVDLKPIPRGRRIEGASIGNPTLSWGGGDDTSISLFNTAGLVAAIDTTIFTVDGSIVIGRDFLSDSPVAVGETLTALIGERLTAQLDYVIGSGNGTTQPEGIFTKSGVTTINTDNGSAGAPTLHDYTALLFAIGKQYRKQVYKPVFLTNDTAYQRSRTMKVDTASPSSDQRAVLDPNMSNFGAGVNAYSTLGWAHRIQNDLSNRYAAFVCLQKYRMYRRMGLEVRFEQGGYTLARANEVLMVYRARFGGKLMDASAAAKWTDGQS